MIKPAPTAEEGLPRLRDRASLYPPDLTTDIAKRPMPPQPRLSTARALASHEKMCYYSATANSVP